MIKDRMSTVPQDYGASLFSRFVRHLGPRCAAVGRLHRFLAEHLLANAAYIT